ncbi:proline racemase [Nakamurella sp. YIM 132087]|uniref:Proline racemase n=1 Tax=Nakamurella alba TaxID=2665158 RepID=A0A7K1FJ92_9ACTN|nr:proline racemase family protein [Nakamurella alba]MTD14158.1 proline racemase [Nakamurella alba]
MPTTDPRSPDWSSVRTVDYHTAGEPFRIVEHPPVPLPGTDVPDRRERALADPDVEFLRQFLCYEPRGHADMYGGFVVPANEVGPGEEPAHFGVLFWHKDGFSTACGHGTIALGVWAVDTGRVAAPEDGSVDVLIDVPSGRVRATVHRSGGLTTGVDFVNVPSRVVARDLKVETSRGMVDVTLTFGGALYASVRAGDLGLRVSPDDVTALIEVGREIKWAANELPEAVHPTDDRLSGVYGTILHEDLGTDPDGNPVQRNVTVFADGEVDRSPCGSGSCARAAVLVQDGVLTPGRTLRHRSIVDSQFDVSVRDTIDGPFGPEVVVAVTGHAHRTGVHEFVLDRTDAIAPGFVLR